MTYRFENWKRLRAPFCPYFLRSLTRVARHQTGLLQGRAKVSVVFQQRARNAVTNCACLSCRSAAVDIDQNVKLGDGLSQLSG